MTLKAAGRCNSSTTTAGNGTRQRKPDLTKAGARAYRATPNTAHASDPPANLQCHPLTPEPAMPLEYQRVVGIVLENPELTAEEREALAAEYERAGCYESLSPLRGASSSVHTWRIESATATNSSPRRMPSWRSARPCGRPPVSRAPAHGGHEVCELEALEASGDSADVAARERVHVALEAMVQIAVVQGRIARSRPPPKTSPSAPSGRSTRPRNALSPSSASAMPCARSCSEPRRGSSTWGSSTSASRTTSPHCSNPAPRPIA